MRESRTCGSERGAPSNGRPYREKPTFRQKSTPIALGETPNRQSSRWRSCCSVAIRKSSMPTSRTTSGAFPTLTS